LERHGSETYFVIGEGMLGETLGGRDRTLSAAAEAQVAPFRFSRIGPSGIGRQLPDGTRKKLGQAMTAGGGGFSSVPAGFTYLGQFVDHDLTFDKTNVMLGQNVSPAQLLQARSPSLDLDSLYGAGPQDPESAKFYSDGVHLKVGDTDDPGFKGFDLPRAGVGSTNAAKREALIPDRRNDENLAVAQTHLMFIRFHNRVVDTLPAALTPAQKFAQARELVVKHYQWMIRHDFLPRLVKKRPLDEVGAAPTDVPTMPVEFSVAGYRLGHSMIRGAYNWNTNFPNHQGTLDLLFTFSGTSGNLGNNLVLLAIWIADFRRLYDFGEAGRADLTVPESEFNRAMRIDTKLVHPLQTLRQKTVGPPPTPDTDPRRNLAFRNLTRAQMVKLGTGQQMLRFLKNKGIVMRGLTKAQIRDGNNGAVLDNLTAAQSDAFLRNTPLWFYALREAELNAGKLRGVGGRIVAETFHRAMEGSEFSIVRDPAFRPSFGPNNTTFRMVDLILFACQGKKKLINPLGP
jgi:hypothetical protein